MDPVSIIGLVGVCTGLADVVLRIAQGLNEYRVKYKEASRTLLRIRNYCNIIQAAVIKIQQWITSTLAVSPTRAAHVAPMRAALTGFVDLMSGLHDEVEMLLGKDSVSGNLNRKARLKVAWKEDAMKEHLQEIHQMAGALHLLLDATRLPTTDAETVIQSIADGRKGSEASDGTALNQEPTGIDRNTSTVDELDLEKLQLAPNFEDAQEPLTKDSDAWTARLVLRFDGGENLDNSSLVIIEALMQQIETIEQRRPLAPEETKTALIPCNYFDEIAGSGTGGIVAIFLGRLRMSSTEALAQYRYMALTILGRAMTTLPFSRNHNAGTASKSVIKEIVEKAISTPGQPFSAKANVFSSPPQMCKTTVVTGDPSRNRENRSIHRSYDVESENPSNSSDLSSTPTLLEHASLSITQVAQLSTANLRLPTQRLFGESWTSSNPVTHPAPFDLMLSIGTGHVASTTPPLSRNDKTRRYFTLLYMPPSRPSVAPRAAGKPGSEDYQDPIQRFQHRYDGLRPVPAFQILSGGDSGSFEQLRATVKAFIARPEVASDLKLVAEELVDVRRRRAVEDPKRFRAFCGEPSGDGS